MRLCGPVSMGTLILRNPPADFSRHERELYFTKQREVARRYSVYAWRRALRDIDVGIMELDVDREWLNENAHYIHGEEWKEYVWINRTEGQMPDHLKYLMGWRCLVREKRCSCNGSGLYKLDSCHSSSEYHLSSTRAAERQVAFF
jgi:hypothetical protein